MPDILDINPGLMFWTIVTFVVLFLVLRKIAWGPILEALEKREKTIRESLDEAARAREESEKRLAEYGRKLEQAGADAQKVLEEGRAMGENLKRDILTKAREEAGEIIDRGRREIELERDKAIAEIRKHTVDISLAAASRVVGKSMTEEDHRRLVLEALENVDGLK